MSEEIRQGSEQWRRVRLGKFTSSKWHLFTVNGKTPGEPSAGVKTYITELLWELICGHSNDFDTWEMKFGKEWEPFAAKEVEKKYKSEYFADECIQHPSLRYYCGSPDGYIVINGMPVTPELKCPTGKEHLVNIKLLKDVETCKTGWPEIYGQCQSNMNLQNTQMALAVSFQNEAGEIMYKDLMIPRDDIYISKTMSKMAEAWDWMQKEAKEYGIDILAKYEEYSKPPVAINQSNHFTAA